LHTDANVLTALVEGALAETDIIKIQAHAKQGACLVAVNDVVVHNRLTTSAVRYRIWLDHDLYANRVVGDGLVVATPFGSTGYYRSITHSLFKLGIGLAFNNSTEPTDHLVIDDTTAIRVEILRGPAVVLADNGPERVQLGNGDEVVIRKSPQRARVLGIDIFRCPACCRLRQSNPDAW
jgi:NAD+ kinase